MDKNKTISDVGITNPKPSQYTPKGVPTSFDAGAYAHLKDSMGRFRTQSLFYEYRLDKYPAPFTLKDFDNHKCLSMYLLYMSKADPSEYAMAIGTLGSWRHWEVLTSSKWFSPFIKRWRAELRVKLESDRFNEMLKVSIDEAGTSQGVQATKWLSDHYSPILTPKRGRPSKQEKVSYLRELDKETEDVNDDAKRLGLTKC